MVDCGYILPGWAFDPCASKPCALKEGHEGPHLSHTREQGPIEWIQPDPSCDCADCLGESGDPMDACIAWSHQMVTQ